MSGGRQTAWVMAALIAGCGTGCGEDRSEVASAEADAPASDDGAADVIIAATHGVLSDPAAERLANCGAREVIVTDTLPIDESKRFPQLTVLSIAPLLASTIRAVFENGSVTGLFDGDA